MHKNTYWGEALSPTTPPAEEVKMTNKQRIEQLESDIADVSRRIDNLSEIINGGGRLVYPPDKGLLGRVNELEKAPVVYVAEPSGSFGYQVVITPALTRHHDPVVVKALTLRGLRRKMQWRQDGLNQQKVIVTYSEREDS